MPAVDLSPSLAIHYQEFNRRGSPAVLLLHGLGASGDSWGYQVPALTGAGFRVIAPDARGFGRSTYPPGSFSIANAASDSARLLELLGAAPAHVVGISMGGIVAQKLALDYPHYIRKLVLANTFAYLRPKAAADWLFFVFRFALVHTLGLPAQARAVVRRLFPGPDQEHLRQELYRQIIRANPSAYRAAMRALVRVNTQPWLEQISLPTLVITAEQDKTVRPDLQRQLAERISGARQVVIKGAGHAVTADQPEVFNQTLLEFLLEEPVAEPVSPAPQAAGAGAGA